MLRYFMRFRACPHNNILSFLGADIDTKGNFQFAFEDYSYYMADYFRVMQKRELEVDEKWLNMLRGVVEGLKYIHSLGLTYGKISPWNVLIKEDISTPKLWRLHECIDLTPNSRELDCLDLAKFIAYCFSDLGMTKDRYISMDVNRILKYIHPKEREAEDVVNILIKYRSRLDILDVIMKHPVFWAAEKRLSYFKEGHELISLKGSPVDKQAIDGLNCWPGTSKWDSKFKRELMKVADKDKIYDYKRVTELIRFIRNLYCHHSEIGRKLYRERCGNYLGFTIKGLELHIRLAFPSLLVRLYKELELQNIHRGKLQRFYNC